MSLLIGTRTGGGGSTSSSAARGWGPEEPGCTVVAREEHLDRVGGDMDRAGEVPRRLNPPGTPAEFVLAWGRHNGRPVAGTPDRGSRRTPARVIERNDGGWLRRLRR